MSIVSDLQSLQDGGTLFCPTSYWAGSTFPRHMFHRGESKRSKVPAHTKISACSFAEVVGVKRLCRLTVRFDTVLGLHKYSSGEPPAHEGWMYLGSHNLYVHRTEDTEPSH